MQTNTIHSALLVAVVAFPAFCADVTALFWYKRNSGGTGIWISHGSSLSKVWDKGTLNGARLSPDGHHIAFGYNGRLYRMKNDGAGEQEICDGFNPDRGEFAYTTNGIFWLEKPLVYRCDLSTGTRTTMIEFSKCKDTPGKGYFGSYDGRRAWVYVDIIPEYNPDRNGHGDMAFVEYNETFTGHTLTGKPGVGYGHMLTLDGQYVLIGDGNDPQYRLLSFTETFIDSSETLPQAEPVENTYPSEHPQGKGVQSKSGFTPCQNDFSRVLMRDESGDYWLLDWTPGNTDPPVKLKSPSAGEPYSGGAWIGSLPDPDGPPVATGTMGRGHSTTAGIIDAHGNPDRIVFAPAPSPERSRVTVYAVSGRARAATVAGRDMDRSGSAGYVIVRQTADSKCVRLMTGGFR